MRTSPIRLLL